MAKPRKHLAKMAKSGDKLFSESWLVQFAALCLRHDRDSGLLQVLLITSRGTKRWVLPKGNPIKGKKPHEVAAFEARQEAGVRGKADRNVLGRYSSVKRFDDGSSRPCVVEVFAIDVEEMVDAFREKGQRELLWVSLSEAARLVDEPELRQILSGMAGRNGTGRR